MKSGGHAKGFWRTAMLAVCGTLASCTNAPLHDPTPIGSIALDAKTAAAKAALAGKHTAAVDKAKPVVASTSPTSAPRALATDEAPRMPMPPGLAPSAVAATVVPPFETVEPRTAPSDTRPTPATFAVTGPALTAVPLEAVVPPVSLAGPLFAGEAVRPTPGLASDAGGARTATLVGAAAPVLPGGLERAAASLPPPGPRSPPLDAAPTAVLCGIGRSHDAGDVAVQQNPCPIDLRPSLRPGEAAQ